MCATHQVRHRHQVVHVRHAALLRREQVSHAVLLLAHGHIFSIVDGLDARGDRVGEELAALAGGLVNSLRVVDAR